MSVEGDIRSLFYYMICIILLLRYTAGAGRNSQVSEVRYNGTNGDRRQRQHSAQYRHQVWNSQTWRRKSRTGRKRIQPEDPRNSRGTGEYSCDTM